VRQRMRWIPPSTFTMGSPYKELGHYHDESPQHRVVLTRPYWLAETPVTQALWLTVMGKNPSTFRGNGREELQRPVETVNWDECEMFLDRLNTRVAGLAARFPTEAEWEQACRAGTTTATWAGDLSGLNEATELDAIAWYRHNSENQTHPVGCKLPNPYGLYDMLGSVYEWCVDVVTSSKSLRAYAKELVTDPVSSGKGPYRCMRGGSWASIASNLRAAFRSVKVRVHREDKIGLRIASATFQ